jgi:hypothetical protein
MKNKPFVRFLGDVHGCYSKYHDLIKKSKYSIQLGDFGFEYNTLDKVDFNNHKILKGNHDNYDIDGPHFLGDFGTIELGGYNIFFIRGSHSIDRQYRIPHQSWWPQEELNHIQANECIELYEKTKPDFVISHDCPIDCYQFLVYNIDKLSYTARLLQILWQIHHPSNWIFAHFHKSWEDTVETTRFRCLNILECIDFPVQ